MSPYLHFGQISPLAVTLAVKRGPAYGQAPFLEELIVRRELSFNYVRYNRAYDRFEGLPAWCRSTLLEHASDPRPYLYSRRELAAAETHDPYWNAAQKEMVLTGKMHGYMRMYWGKKILEWSDSPRGGFPDGAGPEQRLRARRPGPQRVRRDRLGVRQARPAVGPAPRVRDRPVHERRRAEAEVRHRRLRPQDRSARRRLTPDRALENRAGLDYPEGNAARRPTWTAITPSDRTRRGSSRGP
ncbi:MAG: hypothetical protein MZW92_62365 [Comamonadaceae bacterium]|nr:hypothetical protein [Comamonadaceae bacterium]